MRIMSSKLAAKAPRKQTESHEVAGVILAVPNQNRPNQNRPNEGDDERWKDVIAEGVYVFPANQDRTDPLGAEIAELAKTVSVQFATHLHPHVGTGVKVGWIVVGALSLFDRANSGALRWHEVALEGGELALEALGAANSALPEDFQFGAGWTEGTGLLLEATKSAVNGGDANEFVMGKTLEQSLPGEYGKRLLSLAAAAQQSEDRFSPLSAKPIDVEIHSV